MIGIFLPYIMLALGFGWVYMISQAPILLEDADLGWLLWALIVFAGLMAAASFYLGLVGIWAQLRRGRDSAVLTRTAKRMQNEPGYDLPTATRDLLAGGRKGEAVKLYSRVSGLSEGQARMEVEKIENARPD